MASREVGKYRLLRLLGRGGMGVVYEAEDTVLRRRVALKFISAEVATDAVARQRFLREAQSAASLNSPYIVSIFDVGVHGDRMYLAMELFPEGSVQERLQAHGPLPWRLATLIVADVCRGLSAAHEQGLVHRDIKPANLMLANGAAAANRSPPTGGDLDKSVKLADFGLAKRVWSDESAAMTSASTVLGTPHYMSPEQCRAEPLDARSDIYSLGAAYFALLTGRPPYRGDEPLQVMFAHCSAPIPDPCECVGDLPPGCRAVIEQAMAKEPSRRYQSAREFEAALRGLVEAPGVEVAAAESTDGETTATATAVTGTVGARVLATAVARSQRPEVKAGSSYPHDADAKPVPFPRRTLLIGLAILSVLAPLAVILGRHWLLGVSDVPSTSGDKSPKTLSPGSFEVGGQVQSLAYSENGNELACGLMGGPASVWIRSLETQQAPTSLRIGGEDDRYVRAICPLPRRRGMFVAAVGASLVVLTKDGGSSWRSRPLLRLDEANIGWVAAAPDGESLLVAEARWTAGPSRIWSYPLLGHDSVAADTSDESGVSVGERKQVRTHTSGIKTIAVSASGRDLASVGGDSLLEFGPADGGEPVVRPLPREDQQPNDYSHGLAFSSDGKLLAAVADRRVVVWSVPEMVELKQFDVEPRPTHIVLAFAPGQSLLASASGEGVRFWQATTGDSVGGPIARHQGDMVSALLFAANGTMLITGGYDKQVAICDWQRELERGKR